jgi:hypothetical protein
VVIPIPDPATLYLQLLVEGRTEHLLALFSGEPIIDDPRAGRVAGKEAVSRFAGEMHTWLSGLEAGVLPLRVTRGPARSVAEIVLHLYTDGERIELPVAVVVEGSTGGLTEIRVYHSTWPLTGTHQVRPPMLASVPHLDLPDEVGKYQRALAEGRLEDILALFEEDGYAREPSGGEHVHRGKEGLRRFYSNLFSIGGIPLEHCTLTDDGICCLIEYNVTRWGNSPLPPQAGIAAYERGGSGLLAAARIYDDVDVPASV